jgi:hypothetical protein
MVPVTDIESQFILEEGFQEEAALLASIDVSDALIADATVQLELKETILDGIVFAALNMVIQQISDSLVQWIQSGFKGSPGFVQNPEQFFTDVGDQILGQFIASSDLGFLCNPFNIDFRLALNLNFATGRFRQRHGCTLTQVVRNVQNGFDDLSQNGWDGWISMTATPSNNPYGAFMAAQSEAAFRIANKSIIEKDKLNWGNGFLSWEDANGDVQTPGSVVENQINDALDSGKRRLEVADEISEIIGALIGQLMSMATQGLAGVTQRGNTRTAAQIAFDNSLTVTRAGGGPQGQPLTPPPPPPPWRLPTSTRPTTTPIGPPPPGGPSPNPPPANPVNTLVGIHLVGAEVKGSLRGVNVTGMRFTPISGVGLRIQAGPGADEVTTTGIVKIMAGTVFLCPAGNCASVVQVNIANDTGGQGLDVNVDWATTPPMRSVSGFITADPIIGFSTGVSADNVNTSNSDNRTGVPSITNAEIIQAQVTGNVTPSNLVTGRIDGTLVVPPRAHLAERTTYTNNAGGGPPIFNVGQTNNVSLIDSASMHGGLVTSGPFNGYTVLSGNVTNIRGVQNVVSRGGNIYNGFTDGAADVQAGGTITGTITDQGTIRP